MNLTIVYLSEPEDITTFEGFQRPGALHKARWMSKILYTMKMVLLNRKILELPKGTVFAAQQFSKICKFLQFVVYCYVPWWLTAPVPTSAPINDLKFVKTLIEYKKIDSGIANAALGGFAGHLWYLTEKLLTLSLFSSFVSSTVKQQIVDKLVSFEEKGKCHNREGSGYGKPKFPPLPDKDDELSSFVGPDSWQFFKILKIDISFINTPVTDWGSNLAYNKAKSVVSNISVVNDSAERGVKLCHDFIDTAKSNDVLNNILQVVDNSRNTIPNQRNKKPSKSWFLTL